MTRREGRRDRDRAPEGGALVVLLALVGLDLALLAASIALGAEEVRDGAGSVTTGYILAWAVAGALAAAAAMQASPVRRSLRRQAQTFTLAAIAVHAIGHLARLYYDFWWYDDALHVFLVVFASLLAVRFAQEADLFPAKHSTPVRAAVLAVVAAMAIAGAWEVFEFTMDQIQGTREQDDLVDTMRDMIDGLLGGLLAAAWCFRHPRPDPRR